MPAATGICGVIWEAPARRQCRLANGVPGIPSPSCGAKLDRAFHHSGPTGTALGLEKRLSGSLPQTNQNWLMLCYLIHPRLKHGLLCCLGADLFQQLTILIAAVGILFA